MGEFITGIILSEICLSDGPDKGDISGTDI